ncbi:uncharacterized protein CCR75_006419 [Bremia lactucae]|uniref:Uncharacterized protein n=1 Tax=Bremia lactucae TaxID=4779 RepID=A0A976IGB4_BRELC|nr:hypothetical protein CCR75_006419 [Bremia lactucae]
MEIGRSHPPTTPLESPDHRRGDPKGPAARPVVMSFRVSRILNEDIWLAKDAFVMIPKQIHDFKRLNNTIRFHGYLGKFLSGFKFKAAF